MPKIYDCITFYDENFLVNSRFEILNEVVDYFIIVESNYDHQGKKKSLNFKLENKKFEKKVKYIVHDEKNLCKIQNWEAEKLQREKLLLGLGDASSDDVILFSDSDEIPNPKLLKNFHLKKKYAIFMQKFYVYKLNIYNEYESPWEGTRACKKKDLKSFSHLRKKILKKNIEKPFWKLHLEKNIEILNEGGWHFNNLYNIEQISKKIKTSPHQEFNDPRFYDKKIIQENIAELRDLYGRKHNYKKVIIDKTYPDYFIKNLHKLYNYIL
ncbi:glycosyl transferase family 17 [Candidatus Pelagibacter bacterium]|nr:glycosyl transferase family 17 [Candidatus Pelagibacter bacterium]